MALELDTTTALRGTGDLSRLVKAVYAADEHDESDWVEWKSQLDLSTKAGCFQICKAILGMANRLPDRAASKCGGLGYVVVGVEPGQLVGVDSADPATLSQLMDPFIGGPDGPAFSPVYVSVDARVVLVVSVEAPKAGDRIYTLRKEFSKLGRDGRENGGYTSGTVFVRKVGRTVPADAADMDALQERLAARPVVKPQLEVSLVGDIPLSWLDSDGMDGAIESWITDRRRMLVDAATAEEGRRHPMQDPKVDDASVQSTFRAFNSAFDTYAENMGRVGTQLEGLLGEKDHRSLDQYIDEVDSWTTELRSAARGTLVARYMAQHHGAVAVQVANQGERFLSDVEVEVHFGWERAVGTDDSSGDEYLPAPPRNFGERSIATLLGATGISAVRPYLDYRHPAQIPRRTSVEDGSARIRFRVGDLRQGATDRGEDVFILLPARPQGGVLQGTWKATVPDIPGVLEGSLDVQVDEEPVDTRHLLDLEPNEESWHPLR